jgi:hypothetical protein
LLEYRTDKIKYTPHIIKKSLDISNDKLIPIKNNIIPIFFAIIIDILPEGIGRFFLSGWRESFGKSKMSLKT